MKRLLKLLALWGVMGAAYFVIEGVWRIPSNGGWANIAMLPVGGLCGVAVGSINQIPAFYKAKVLVQAVAGAAVILCVELFSGLLLNHWLGLAIWDYSHLPLNIAGQICLPFAALWVGLAPFAIWLEDALRWAFWREGEYYPLRKIYWEFITLK